jgi:hypothetical protein
MLVLESLKAVWGDVVLCGWGRCGRSHGGLG